jgi:hypothetical protein
MHLGNAVLAVLDEVPHWLGWAWGIDKKFPKDYPVNTGQAFYEIKGLIREAQSKEPGTRSALIGDNQNKSAPRKTSGSKPLKLGTPPSAKHFSDLVDDVVVKIVYESQNADSYSKALQRAVKGDASTFRKILRAVENAYVIDRVGVEAAPPPRIHFLHTNLLEIATLLEISDIEHQGMSEFLDDLCPCGKEHKPDAIRKRRKRPSRTSMAD